MHKLLALIQRQKMVNIPSFQLKSENLTCQIIINSTYSLCQVLQRKSEEAAMATKRLKEVLDSRKASSRMPYGIEFVKIHSLCRFLFHFFSCFYIIVVNFICR